MNTYATPITRLSSLVLLIGIACCFPFAVQAQSSSITQISTVSERGVPPAAAPAATPVERSAAHWTLFSEGLVDALTSGHDGVQQGALRMIIFYGDHLDVKAAVFDFLRLYRHRLSVTRLHNRRFVEEIAIAINEARAVAQGANA